MQIPLVNMGKHLLPGKLETLRCALGAMLICSEGRVWVTVEGQVEDFLLVQGQILQIKSNGLVLIQGFPSGKIRLSVGRFNEVRNGE